MNIIAFDTCFDACSVGVGLGGPSLRLVRAIEPMETGHAERLVPMIREALATAGIGWDHVERIGVTIGPGTFTGTRIGVATARALALARNLPVAAVSSLEVMALSGRIETAGAEPSTILVAVDARRDEVYVQSFSGVDRCPASPPAVLPLAEAARVGGLSAVVIAGPAAERLAKAAEALGRPVVASVVTRHADIGDAVRRLMEIEPLATLPRPLYLRPPDAKPQVGKSVARQTPLVSREQ